MKADETRGDDRRSDEIRTGVRSSRLSEKVAVLVEFLDLGTPSRSPMHRVQVFVWLALMLHSCDDGTDKRVTAFSQWPG